MLRYEVAALSKLTAFFIFNRGVLHRELADYGNRYLDDNAGSSILYNKLSLS
jgi:hypothetical protein